MDAVHDNYSAGYEIYKFNLITDENCKLMIVPIQNACNVLLEESGSLIIKTANILSSNVLIGYMYGMCFITLFIKLNNFFLILLKLL